HDLLDTATASLAASASLVDTFAISKPIVDTPSAAYTNVVFHQGDRVVMWAGGCVRYASGANKLRRYVDPAGEDADIYYYGTVKTSRLYSVHYGAAFKAYTKLSALTLSSGNRDTLVALATDTLVLG